MFYLSSIFIDTTITKYLINLGSGAEYDRNSAVDLISEKEYGRSIPTDTYSISKFIISNEIENSLQNNF